MILRSAGWGLVVAAASCSSPPETGAGAADAGDAGPDGSLDAPADAPVEAPADAPGDAPPDVAPPTGTPIWEDLPFQVVGCTVQRLTNAAELKLYNWKACEGLESCTEAVWHPQLITPGAEIGRRTNVVDDGQLVRVAVTFLNNETWEQGAFVALEDGSLLLGLRTSTEGGMCFLNIPSIGGSRFGLQALRSASDAGPVREGGLLASVTDLSVLTPFEIDPLPPGTGPDEVAMGDARWLWRFAPDQLTTFSNVDGSDFTVFAKISQTTLLLGWPTTTGPSFLFDVLEAPDGGALEEYIGRSDGVEPFERYVSGPPGSWVGSAMFAQSHIAWLRGVNPQAVGKFDAVEVWASPHAENSAQLAPFKVGDLQGDSWGRGVGGWGRCSTFGKIEQPVLHEMLVWDLTAKTKRAIGLPAPRFYDALPSLTRSAFWVVHGPPPRGLLRFQL